NGVFDILHRGHVDYLTKARTFGDVLIVGLNSDASTRRLKGANRPIFSQKDRATVLLALKAVDYVVIFKEDTPDKIIQKVKPDILVKGADYQLADIAGAEFVTKRGGKVRRVRLTRGRSTSKTIKKIQNSR
ncbi:MAG: D-glycero-beta-D-manno-heptose 1-phosphate adenylyltransferase, partial [candidate division Zixibacteria bacterium]|nr:D-glycero-beta-D-manno-heptose 1-phosphate adenylyltransferase [candidate division Zixibacteria bacterium]